MARTLRLAYRGNFGVDFSTESHVAGSIEQLGHEVVRIEESVVDWPTTVAMADGCDVFLWTQTYGFAASWPRESAVAALDRLNARMPTVGMHLDLWWGLARVDQVPVEPFFQQLAYVFTADGDHDAEWAGAGVNHRWLPPAVYGLECYPGTPRASLRSEVAFVGSWRQYGHEEWWPYRHRVIDYLRRRYRNRFRCWPRGRAVRGRDLNDLYASVGVVVGDSCFADRSRRYWSDRVPETIGRGGFLVMPWIEGLAEDYRDGEHCVYYSHGDLDALGTTVDRWLADPDGRARVQSAGLAHVRAGHTYAHRVQTIIDTLAADGALAAAA